MRSSSTRRRFGAALTATSLAVLLGLGGTAVAGAEGRGDAHRSDRSGGDRTGVPAEGENDDDSQVPDPNGDADNAHPSGNDRHEDQGTQGRSTSDPDDDGRGPDRSNGGPDKPFETTDGSGGDDLGDQDGNNGCGNDDDFEDDNEGWCGRKPAPTTPERPVVGGANEVTCPEGSTMPAGGTDVDDCEQPTTTGGTPAGEVLGTTVSNVTPTVATTAVAPMATEVLGVTLERPAIAAAPAAAAVTPATDRTAVLGATLARTGFGLTVVALLGLALLLVGFAIKRAA